MKRTLSAVALALVFVLMMGCLAACGSGSGDKLQAGTYNLKEASGEGAEMYESMKDSITLVVNEDGTASLNLAGITGIDLVFDESSGKVSMDESEVPFTVSGNTVTIEDSSGKLVFEK